MVQNGVGIVVYVYNWCQFCSGGIVVIVGGCCVKQLFKCYRVFYVKSQWQVCIINGNISWSNIVRYSKFFWYYLYYIGIDVVIDVYNL